MQNYKKYAIPPAQLIIADVPYNVGNNFYGRDFDIIRVFKVKNNFITSLEHLFKDESLELIWERDVTKHIPAEEMRQQLEELTGEKIEIEPSREEMLGVCYKYCKNYTDSLFCKGCHLCEIDGCEFVNLSDEELKQCYEKVTGNGK